MRSHYDHLIVGGGIAGATAAETIRQKDADATIAVVGDEPHPLYSRVLLPHVVRGKIPEEKAVLKREGYFADRGIEYLSGTRVKAVRADRHEAIIDGAAVGYGKLLIATGGSPRRLSCPGSDDANVLSFQTLDDARLLSASMSSGPAVVYGGGFIGLELIMSFVHRGVPVVSVVRGDGFFSRVLDGESRARVDAALARHGVVRKRGVEVVGVERAGVATRVHLSDGDRVQCAVIGAGLGLEPNVAFLGGSGIEVRTGVVVDGMLRASMPDVFAAGDVAEYPDPIVGERHVVGNWQNAMFQGRTAGANMAGDGLAYGALTSYSITCFELPIAFVGPVDVAPEARVVRVTDQGVLQLFLRQNRLFGATCVGAFPERAAIGKLIEAKKVLNEAELSALSDPKTGVASVL